MATQEFEAQLHKHILDLVRNQADFMQQQVIQIQSQMQQALNGFLEQSETQLHQLQQDAALAKAVRTSVEEIFAAGMASAPQSELLEPPPVNADMAILKAALLDIQTKQTQADVLTCLVQHAGRFAPRVALFIVKAGNVVGWTGRGFGDETADQAIRGLSISLQADTILRTVLSRQSTFSGQLTDHADNQLVLERMGEALPERISGMPLLVRGKAAAVLYLDSGTQPGDSINLEPLEILTNVSGLTVELISVRGRSANIGGTTSVASVPEPPAPTPTPVAVVTPVPTPVEAPPTPPEPAPAPVVEPSAAEPAPETVRTLDPVQPTPAVEPEVEVAAAPSAPEPSGFAVVAEAAEVEPQPESPAPRAEIPEPEPEPQPEPVVEASTAESEAVEEQPVPAAYQVEATPAAQPEPVAPVVSTTGYQPDSYAFQPAAPPPPPVQFEIPPSMTPEPTPVPMWQPPAQAFTPPPAYEPPPAWQPAPPPPPQFEAPPVPEPPPAWQPAPPPPPMPQFEAPPPPPEPPPAWQPAPPPPPMPQFEAPPPAPEPPPAPVWQPAPPPPPPAAPVSMASKGQTGRLSAMLGDITEEEQKLHNDARRFARLLVSEIKLYNEPKVIEGRKNHDLYDRLREDIDRSRQMYDKRVSPMVAARFDYFHDELVNTLGEGDPKKLGRDCPGPSVQT